MELGEFAVVALDHHVFSDDPAATPVADFLSGLTFGERVEVHLAPERPFGARVVEARIRGGRVGFLEYGHAGPIERLLRQEIELDAEVAMIEPNGRTGERLWIAVAVRVNQIPRRINPFFGPDPVVRPVTVTPLPYSSGADPTTSGSRSNPRAMRSQPCMPPAGRPELS